MGTQTFPISNDNDLNELRENLRQVASECGFSEFEVTKLVTATSEISRNILNYAESGKATVEVAEIQPEEVQLIFEDDGPGIEDIDRAMEDGYSGEQSSGLGVGLPGAKRLTDEFTIKSSPNDGTTVSFVVRRDQFD